MSISSLKHRLKDRYNLSNITLRDRGEKFEHLVIKVGDEVQLRIQREDGMFHVEGAINTFEPIDRLYEDQGELIQFLDTVFTPG